MSALFFALFHGNFYQFFYAFGLGAMFAFIYVKTGRLRYTILLHMIINSLSAVVVPLILNLVDMTLLNEALYAMSEDPTMFFEIAGPTLPGVILYAAYLICYLGAVLAGIVLLIVNARKFRTAPGIYPIPRDLAFRTVILNTGVILYILVCIIMFAMNFMAF